MESWQFFRTHRLFAQFVLPEVVDSILRHEKRQRLGGVEKEVSIEQKDHAFAAIKAAIEVQEAINRLRTKWKLMDPSLFEVGIGICTGTVAIGLVGSNEHKQFTAIGDTTNIAARLQGLSRVLESPILIHSSTYEQAKDRIIAEELPPVELKGKSEKQRVYKVKGLA